jgi:acyl-CoA reductase-like NAD-dependent aldehyde dehydrogenase
MSDTTPALINGDDVLTSSVSEVHSPYDGSLVGSVPACSTDDLDRAVAVALERHRSGALPA